MIDLELITSTRTELTARIIVIERNQAVTDATVQHLSTEVKSVRETLQWLNRLVVGAVIAALMAIVLKGGIGA